MFSVDGPSQSPDIELASCLCEAVIKTDSSLHLMRRCDASYICLVFTQPDMAY